MREDPVWTTEENGLKPPTAMQITHVRPSSQCTPRHLRNLPRHQISGNFKTFTAYSTGSESIVLTGNIESDPAANLASPSTHTPPFKPTILPRLQSPHNSVIFVVLGDYHFGCLTSTGKLLTWGAFSKGALGLGDPLDLDAGKPGGFNSQRDKNVAQTAAGSGHMPVTPPGSERAD